MQLSLKEKEQDLLDKGMMLPLMEEFYTIQGEGYHTGKAAYFIRVGGCDVGCHWCDVKESWDPKLHPLTETDKIIRSASENPAKTVVVTGGEPSAYQMEYLTQGLIKNGVQIHIETSGAYLLTGEWHWICLSPKKTAPPVGDIHAKADELKIIVFNQHDFKWAEEHADKVSKTCKLYLQPEWSKREKILPQIIDYVQEHPRWEVSLQTHKYMGVP